MPAQPVPYRGGDPVGRLQLRRVPDSGQDNRLPARVPGGRPAHAGHRHQPVGLAADEQDRDPHRGHHLPVAPAQANYPHQRPGCGQEGLVPGPQALAVAFGGQRDRRGEQRRVDPGRVGEAEVDDPLDGRLRRLAGQHRPDVELAQAGQRVHQELAPHHPVGGLRRQRQGRVDQDKTGHGVRRAGRLHDRDQPAHGVPGQDHRRAGDLPDEPVEQPGVALHGGRGPGARGQAEPVQVKRDRAAPSGQPGPDQAPVQVRPAQAVHEHDRRPAARSRLAVELDPVHRRVQVGDVAARSPRRGERPPRRPGRGRGAHRGFRAHRG
jgi:hypothetical protein